MPSGRVALRDVDPGLAIDTFDLRFMPFSIYLDLFISTYLLAEELIYGVLFAKQQQTSKKLLS